MLRKCHSGIFATAAEANGIVHSPFRLSESQFGPISVEDLEVMEYDESSEPIHKRAWTLQESLLAQRYLIYSSRTLQWCCKTGVRTLGNSLHLVSYAEEDKYSQSLYTLSKPTSDQEGELSRWFRLLHVYSERSASFLHDKLNAISAIAKGFLPVLGPLYFAGVWQFSILRQLLWVTSSSWDSEAANSRPKVYRAPSWSWASIDGRLVYDIEFSEADDEKQFYRCEFMSCETVLTSAHFPFGEVLAGSLKLIGVLKQAWLKHSTKNVLWLADNDDTLDAAEALHLAKSGQGIAEEGQDDGWSDSAAGVKGYHDETGDWCPMLVFCLPILVYKDKIPMGLPLEMVEKDIYKRVEVFEDANKGDLDHLSQHEIMII